jgi:arylsulfatase A-like enzyme
VQFVKERRDDAPSPETLNQYLNVIRQTDHQIGRLLDFLRERGLANDTLVVVTGDHGEAFGWPHGYYGHGLQIYQEIVHVPLLLWNPRAFASAGRAATLGGQVDLAPTILDVLGIAEVPAGWQGRSLFDSRRNGRIYLFAAGYDYLLGLREGSMKYALNATTGREELFDLGRDGDEMVNLAETRGAETKLFRQRLAAWADDQEARAGAMAGQVSGGPGGKKKRR